MNRYCFFPLLALFAVLSPPNAGAQDALIQAIDRQVQSNREAGAAQQNVDRLSDQSKQLLEEYRETLRKTEALAAYNAQLRRLLASQQQEKLSLRQQLGDIELTRRDIVPLMLKMTDTLDRFVHLDRPFLPEERTRRIADLKALMNRADVSDAEKFRRILEAYQIENEYGKTIEAYRSELDNGGNPRTVDFLRIGRIALLYQSLDGRETGLWNDKSRHWQTLSSDFNKAVRKGLAIARKESAPELLPIVVNRPETAQ